MFVEMHTCSYLGPRDEEESMPKARPEGPPLRGFRPSRVAGQRPDIFQRKQGTRSTDDQGKMSIGVLKDPPAEAQETALIRRTDERRNVHIGTFA